MICSEPEGSHPSTITEILANQHCGIFNTEGAATQPLLTFSYFFPPVFLSDSPGCLNYIAR